MSTIGFIGSGNMAEALIKGLISSGVCKSNDIFISDINKDRLAFVEKEYAVKTFDSNNQLARQADILILSVKPQQMQQVLEGIKSDVRKDALVISIAAGIKIEKIQAVLGGIAIVRVMPNTPALIGEGISGFFANDKAKSRTAEVVKILEAVGQAVMVDKEELIDAVTAVSGSGPAYYFFLMEQMIKAASELGLTDQAAKKLVLQTAKGAAMLAIEADKKGESPQILRKKVTSPGGTTEAAIKVMTEGKYEELMTAAVKRACERSKELSK